MLIRQPTRAITSAPALQTQAVGVLLLASCLMSIPIEAKQVSRRGFADIMQRAHQMRQWHQRDEALKLYREAVKLRPADSEAHAGLGWILFELRHVDEAMREEIQAIKLDPKNANAYHHLGAIYLSLNMWNEAADQFRMSLSLDPRKRCNCGPIESLLLTHPPGGAIMTPQEADRVLGISTPANPASK